MAYATRAKLEALYGSVNVARWADLNNTEDETEIDACITGALADAEAEADDRMRGGPYAIPFTTVPACVERATALLAGVMLYEHRGVVDYDPETGKPQHQLAYQKREAEAIFISLRDGSRKLASPIIATNIPDVVPST